MLLRKWVGQIKKIKNDQVQLPIFDVFLNFSCWNTDFPENKCVNQKNREQVRVTIFKLKAQKIA